MKFFIKKNNYLYALYLLAASSALALTLIIPEEKSNYSVEFIEKENALVEKKSTISAIPISKNKRELSKDKSILNKNDPLNIQNIDLYLGSFSSNLILAADLQEKFDGNTTDSIAARESESELSYVFYQGMEWQEFSPLEINCKTQICRVKLSVDNQEKIPILMELITNQMTENRVHFDYAIPVNLPHEGFNYIYLIKTNSFGVLP